MIVVLLLVVVLVALGAAGLLGIGVLSDDNRRPRAGMLAALSAPVVLVIGVVLLAAMVLALRGTVGHEPEESPAATTAPRQPLSERPQPQPQPPGVDYESGRVVPGVLLAAALVAVAAVIARRTDWTKPTEAATPALDGADLRSGRSLDELFGTDEELDERDPIPW